MCALSSDPCCTPCSFTPWSIIVSSGKERGGVGGERERDERLVRVGGGVERRELGGGGGREREFLDFIVPSTAQGHLRTKEKGRQRGSDRQVETETDTQKPTRKQEEKGATEITKDSERQNDRERQRRRRTQNQKEREREEEVSKLVFYAQSTRRRRIEDRDGVRERKEEEREREKREGEGGGGCLKWVPTCVWLPPIANRPFFEGKLLLRYLSWCNTKC